MPGRGTAHDSALWPTALKQRRTMLIARAYAEERRSLERVYNSEHWRLGILALIITPTDFYRAIAD